MPRRRRESPTESGTVNLNASIEDEYATFDNPDERRAYRKQQHELALIREKKGIIGKLTGSDNGTLNTGLFVLMIFTVLYAVSLFAVKWAPDTLKQVPDNIFRLMLTALGFVLGSHITARER